MSDLTAHLPGFLAAYTILLVGASSPGPAVAMLVGIANSQGRAPALVTTLGIATGSMTINLLTLLGVGLLLSQAAWAMGLLKVLGACYLSYLAYGAFRKALHPPQLSPIGMQRSTPARQFMMGYLLQVTNPKAIAFWLAIASLGAVEGASGTVIALFVAGAFLLSLGCHGAWAIALSAAPVRTAYAASRRWIEAGLGTFFTYAAFRLATAER